MPPFHVMDVLPAAKAVDGAFHVYADVALPDHGLDASQRLRSTPASDRAEGHHFVHMLFAGSPEGITEALRRTLRGESPMCGPRRSG